ncbi:MAG: hypothetical protein IJY19_09545 [Ruminococcus sp.]|nr:hypothetical protein [Ruminococcus sp.]
MKKLKFNSTLNHKQSDYKTREIIVEKWTILNKVDRKIKKAIQIGQVTKGY